MTKRLIPIFVALCACCIAGYAAGNNRALNNTLRDLKNELHTSYTHLPQTQDYFDGVYERRHQEILDAITTSSEQSIMLYTQESHMTFNMTYVLKSVSREYKTFTESKHYGQGINTVNFHIDRYARLIEALRRLPPQMKEIKETIVPDSLLYHNDSLDIHFSQSASTLEKEIIRMVKDSASAPFVLDEKGEEYRDSCIFYASEVLKMYASNRTKIMRDSIHYQEASMRMKENYEYAEERYMELQDYIFREGQIPYIALIKDYSGFKKVLDTEISKQYDLSQFENKDENSQLRIEDLSVQSTHILLIVVCALLLITLVVFWGTIYLILWLIHRFAKFNWLKRKQLPLLSILTGTILYILLISPLFNDVEYIHMGVKNINTFLWLLIAFAGSMLLRIKPNQKKHRLLLYLPLFVIAFFIIIARNTFFPDSLLVLIMPPLMLLVSIRQLVGCLLSNGKTSTVDMRLGWASLIVYVIVFVAAFMGYTFVSLLIFIWWYFQLAVALAVICVSELLGRYKTKRLDDKVKAMRESITYVSGEDRESLLFGATWLYDLMREVVIPVMIVLSLPMCVQLSLNIFDFNDLFIKYYTEPFFINVGNDGIESMSISVKSIVFLTALFLILRYLNRAIHALWQYFRYRLFMRKYNRTTIRANEINLSLGNSIISVIVWMTFICILVYQWKVPTGWRALVAGGLSAGIGLALKDRLNNFIYGIQLLGGRLRVGDWIECDGVRGKVTAINYQCVQMETLDGTEMSFLNSSLFGKNFNNLTRNNSYERVKIFVGVSYGTDIQRVREVLLEAMNRMRTKDRYGREIVDPKYGIKVMVDEMSDSAVNIAVTQFVLVAERLPFVDRAKEVVYNALYEAGITIPFPQCDVHLIKD